MVTMLTLSSIMPAAMVLLHGKFTVIAEKKKKSNHDLCLLRVHCDENREQGSFNRRWVKTRKKYVFISVYLCWVIM